MISNGANLNRANNRGETAISIAKLLQSDQQQNFINALLGKHISSIIHISYLTSFMKNLTIIFRIISETPQTVSSKLHTSTAGKSIES